MNARRLTLTTVVSLCVFVCALVAGTVSAGAATQFGSYGTGPGQFKAAGRIAVDQASGDVYVADPGQSRIDKFDGSGNFLMAWGWGVLNGAEEPQTCTTSCQAGHEGHGAGEFGADSPRGVAVDNDPLSSSYGDVYVTDPDRHSVEKFNASGEFLLAFGESGAGNGQFTWTGAEGNVIAVGPTGSVYVGDLARVEVFEPSGAWRENVSLAGLSSSEYVTSLAVDDSGDIFVRDGGFLGIGGVAGVHEFAPGGTEKATQFDAGSTTISALAVDGSGDVFVGDVSGGFHVLEYSSTGEKLASFGASPAMYTGAMALAPTPGAPLYVTHYNEEPQEPREAYVSVLAVPKPGAPIVEPGSISAVPGRGGRASVKATIDAEGVATTYRVEYIGDSDFQAGGFTGASNSPEVSVGSKFEEVQVSVALSELLPGGTYHYRVVATNADGTMTSADQTFTTIPPALITGPWVAEVTGTSATFAAQINPLGSSTDYRLEYGTSTAYGQSLAGNVGEGEGDVLVIYHRQDLLPGTTYHYRVVVHNEVGVFESGDHTFTTQAAGGQELSLPDGRAWELVSPPDKAGALLGLIPGGAGEFGSMQASSDGSGITYRASEPVGEGAVGHIFGAQVLSMRDASGWSTQNISQREALPPEGESANSLFGAGEHWSVFSADLSLGLLEPSVNAPPQSPDATERTLYLRNSADGIYQPLESRSNVLAGVKFGDPTLEFDAGTPDLGHVIFGTSMALTPDATPGKECSSEPCSNLYEWSAGRLQLVNVMPDGKTEPGASLGSQESRGAMIARAISSDGRWVVWQYGTLAGSNPSTRIYVRDMVEKRTFRVGGNLARFESMSGDGSRVFFLETRGNAGSQPLSGDLYMFDTGSDTQVDLTASHLAGEASAGVQSNLMGVSDGGSYVYFVATGVLASGGVSGANNLYFLRESGGVWITRFIAALSSEDMNSWRGGPSEFGEGRALYRQSSRVSPSGRFVAFMSDRSLTGYDNLDALSGRPDEEVYLFDAVNSSLVCASCNPTGARPVGVFDNRKRGEPLLADIETIWSSNGGVGAGLGTDHWLGGSIPGWDNVGLRSSYQPRYLSDSGRLFFDSPDVLVAQDTNGLEDVYEYEPPGVGDCNSASPTFGERSRGCVSLISSGLSGSESAFMDASENGDDVFFATGSRLTPEDYDTSYDVYDAHVCSTTVPCRAVHVVPPACSSGDSCKAAPSPQPEIFGPAPSATFSGTGNVLEEAKKGKVKRKVKPKKHAKRKRKAERASKTHSGGKARSVKISGKGGRRS